MIPFIIGAIVALVITVCAPKALKHYFRVYTLKP